MEATLLELDFIKKKLDMEISVNQKDISSLIKNMKRHKENIEYSTKYLPNDSNNYHANQIKYSSESLSSLKNSLYNERKLSEELSNKKERLDKMIRARIMKILE